MSLMTEDIMALMDVSSLDEAIRGDWGRTGTGTEVGYWTYPTSVVKIDLTHDMKTEG